MIFYCGEDNATIVFALGEGGRAFGRSPRYNPTDPPLFSGPTAVPGRYPFFEEWRAVAAFQTLIPPVFQQQVAFGITVPPMTLPPSMWAVINPEGDLMTRAQFLEHEKGCRRIFSHISTSSQRSRPEKDAQR